MSILGRYDIRVNINSRPGKELPKSTELLVRCIGGPVPVKLRRGLGSDGSAVSNKKRRLWIIFGKGEAGLQFVENRKRNRGQEAKMKGRFGEGERACCLRWKRVHANDSLKMKLR